MCLYFNFVSWCLLSLKIWHPVTQQRREGVRKGKAISNLMGKGSEGGSAIFHFPTVTSAITQTQRQPTGRWWKQRLAKVIGNTLALKNNTKIKQPATGSECDCESDNLVLLCTDSIPSLYLFTSQAPGSSCADSVKSENEAVLCPRERLQPSPVGSQACNVAFSPGDT